MTTNIDRTAEFILDFGGPYSDPRDLAQALADANLLAPEPHVVWVVDELRVIAQRWIDNAPEKPEGREATFGEAYAIAHAHAGRTVLDHLAPAPRATVTREQVLEVIQAHSRKYVIDEDHCDACGVDLPWPRTIYEHTTDAIMALLTTPAEKGGA